MSFDTNAALRTLVCSIEWCLITEFVAVTSFSNGICEFVRSLNERQINNTNESMMTSNSHCANTAIYISQYMALFFAVFNRKTLLLFLRAYLQVSFSCYFPRRSFIAKILFHRQQNDDQLVMIYFNDTLLSIYVHNICYLVEL